MRTRKLTPLGWGVVLYGILMVVVVYWIAVRLPGQVVDPIPDKLRTDLLRVQRDQLAAEKDKQAAMMTYHAAESRYEAARHNLAVLQSDAEQRCAADGRKYDSEQVACVAVR